jgi:hypothetical protein
MQYARLLDFIKSHTSRTGASSTSAYEYLTWYREYYKACSKMQRDHRWIWNVTYLDATPTAGLIQLPYKAANLPVLVEDQQNSLGGLPIDGMTRFYNSYVYNQASRDQGGVKYIQEPPTTTAEYSRYVKTYVAATKIVTKADTDAVFVADALIGKAVRFNGEETWYLIADNDTTTFTLDRAYREGGDNGTPAMTTATLYEIEPAGCMKLYFPQAAGSYRLHYALRFRPAVNTTDDCGWDARMDDFMIDMIAGQILITTSGGDGVMFNKGQGMIASAKKESDKLFADIIGPSSMQQYRFIHPDAPGGAGSDYSAIGCLDENLGPRYDAWRRRG